MGRPFIASRIGGLSDIIVDGETGLLVTPGDWRALQQAIGRLLADQELRERMGAMAKQRAVEFQARTVVPRIEHLSRGVAAMKSTQISTQVRSQKNCPSCGTELPNHAHFCRHCGYALGATTTMSEATNTSYTSTADEQRLSAATIDSHTPTFLQKVVSNPPMAAQHIIAVVLVRAQDPEPECHLSRQKATEGAIAWGWLPLLALTSSLGVFSVAYANTSARSGAAGVVCSSGLVYS